MAKRLLKRAWSVDDVMKMKYKILEWDKKFAQAFGQPPTTGVWFVWGASGSGKSSFVMQLILELANFERIVVNDLEEGADMSVQDAFKRYNITNIRRRLLWVKETMEDFDERLCQRKAPKIAVINSYQYTGGVRGMRFDAYMKFKERHSDKLIIFISHCDGKEPEGMSAINAMKDAGVKIWVEGYKAFSKGRYNADGVFTIWKEGAELYHGVD